MARIEEIKAKFDEPHISNLKSSVLCCKYLPKLFEIAKLGKIIAEADPLECAPESLRAIMRKLIAELESL